MALYHSEKIGGGGDWTDITNRITLNSSITWIMENTIFFQRGKLIKFTLRGQFPSSWTEKTPIASFSFVPKNQELFVIGSTDWGSSTPVIAFACTQVVRKTIEVNGAANVKSKKFMIAGSFLIE